MVELMVVAAMISIATLLMALFITEEAPLSIFIATVVFLVIFLGAIAFEPMEVATYSGTVVGINENSLVVRIDKETVTKEVISVTAEDAVKLDLGIGTPMDIECKTGDFTEVEICKLKEMEDGISK